MDIVRPMCNQLDIIIFIIFIFSLFSVSFEGRVPYIPFNQFNIPNKQYNKRIEGHTLMTLSTTDLINCWEKCEQRAACASINYDRRSLVCDLNYDTPVTEILSRQMGYVYVEKNNLTNQVTCGNSSCGRGEVCDSETKQCSMKECNHLPLSTGVNMKGNMLATGNKRTLQCKQGYMPTNGPDFSMTTECRDGNWDKTLACDPLTCEGLAKVGVLSTAVHESYDTGSGKIIEIFCDFGVNSSIGYTYISPTTLHSEILLSNHYNRQDHVILKYVSDYGHFESKMEVLPEYSVTFNVSVFINEQPDFNPPTSVVTNPYMYMGFVPISFGVHGGRIMGYLCFGTEYTFIIDGENRSNYFTLFESVQNQTTARYCWSGGQVRDGWLFCSRPVIQALPDSFYFDWYEVHMGGGGCLVRNCVGTVRGMSFGLPFDY